jgi:hypothetical protein
MKYCSGLVLEVCCGNGRFLDVRTFEYLQRRDGYGVWRLSRNIYR